MKLLFKVIGGHNTSYDLEIEPQDSIETVRVKLAQHMECGADQLRLVWRQRQLENKRTPHDLNIPDGDIIHVLFKFQ